MPSPMGQILLSSGTITEEELDRALDEQKSGAGRLGAILVNLGYATQEEIDEALA